MCVTENVTGMGDGDGGDTIPFHPSPPLPVIDKIYMYIRNKLLGFRNNIRITLRKFRKIKN